MAVYVKEKGINLSVMSRSTGIGYNALYASLSKLDISTRELRADEFMLICNFLDVDPKLFNAKTPAEAAGE
jgi:lambda repressor-like predicted transcriptional regulator